jgi:hypothetical protein
MRCILFLLLSGLEIHETALSKLSGLDSFNKTRVQLRNAPIIPLPLALSYEITYSISTLQHFNFKLNTPCSGNKREAGPHVCADTHVCSESH